MTQRAEMGHDFGVYILTYPGDFHLAKGLIASLRFFHPDLPIVIIPGEGVRADDHPFDVPLMPAPGGFWGELGFIDRKFWAFQGPFDRFLYLDADIICTRRLDPFVARIRETTGAFLYAQLNVEDADWRQSIREPTHPQHAESLWRVENQLGDPARLVEFDPAYDPYARYPFNAGVLASARGVIDEAAFRDLHGRESAFHRERLGKSFSWRSRALFYRDQGRINYLVDRLRIPLYNTRPDGNDVWGGLPTVVTPEKLDSPDLGFTFIHWAGVPSPTPSVFCRAPLLSVLAATYRCGNGYERLAEIPGYSLWCRMIRDTAPELLGWWARLRWSVGDVWRLWRRRRAWLRNRRPHPGGAFSDACRTRSRPSKNPV